MLQVRETDIDSITETFALLLKGKRPGPIEVPSDLPEGELRQALGFMNAFLEAYDETAAFALQLGRGELGSDPPRGKLAVLQSLKALHASLRNLTWTTQRIAEGDFSQQVSFMGEFSEAFNRMARQLEESFEERARVEAQLREQVKEMARTRRAMLNILEDLKRAHEGPRDEAGRARAGEAQGRQEGRP